VAGRAQAGQGVSCRGPRNRPDRGRQTAATSPGQALLNDLGAAWSTTYDAAKIAALYAPDAVMHDTVAGETSTGLAAIQAKASNYISKSACSR
jgi:hypothetical protein